jgi:hypothetical protein
VGTRVPTRHLLLLLLLFFALTVPLSWWWLESGQGHYARFLLAILDPVYDAIGIRHQRGGPAAPRFVSLVSFVVLMAITPGMAWRHRLLGMLIGVALIAGFHMLLFVVVDAAYVVLGRSRRALAKIVPFLLINDGLPFVVWVVFARDFLRRVVPGLGEPGAAAPERPPDGPPPAPHPPPRDEV